ncbi:hypothetical protein R5W24_003748 [Gemmata sp. JC717]|uniref:hypothetical protein n=1 Tax=Gemmata algarum TaxID=2975278 RepID=UPI0021BB1619|nr:hypothetical protein [Gemmata algarum]MDY3554622.1 hypothetical protein [Gemmata algarum]
MRKFVPLVLIAAAAVGGCARPTQPNSRSDELRGDAKALQGVWAITSAEDGHIETLTGAERKDAEEMIKQVRLVFDGHRMIIVEQGENEPVSFTLDESKNPKVLALRLGGPDVPVAASTARAGTAAAPRATAAFSTARAGSYRAGTSRGAAYGTGAGSANPPRPSETWRWIYKLDGDTLTVAFIKKNKTLVPTEFKPRAESSQPGQPAVPAVMVITLKRTTEPPPFRTRASASTQAVSTLPIRATAK